MGSYFCLLFLLWAFRVSCGSPPCQEPVNLPKNIHDNRRGRHCACPGFRLNGLMPERQCPPRDRERRIVSAPQRGAVYQPGVKPRVWRFNNGGVLKERRIFLNDRPVANQP
jgi:hypothetical protein